MWRLADCSNRMYRLVQLISHCALRGERRRAAESDERSCFVYCAQGRSVARSRDVKVARDARRQGHQAGVKVVLHRLMSAIVFVLGGVKRVHCCLRWHCIILTQITKMYFLASKREDVSTQYIDGLTDYHYHCLVYSISRFVNLSFV